MDHNLPHSGGSIGTSDPYDAIGAGNTLPGCGVSTNSTLPHFPDSTFSPVQLENEKFHGAQQLSNYHFNEPHNEIIEVVIFRRKYFFNFFILAIPK